MLIVNGKNQQNDIIISLGVLAGLLFIVRLDLPIIDPLLASLISIYILYTAVRIFFETITELMDSERDDRIYQSIFDAVSETRGAAHPHRARVRKLSTLYVIDLDIEVRGDKTVTEAHEVAMEGERLIMEKIDNVYDIMVHVEPKGNVESEEKFGISEEEDGRKE
jgi:cation diffusion facilitator family transporter